MEYRKPIGFVIPKKRRVEVPVPELAEEDTSSSSSVPEIPEGSEIREATEDEKAQLQALIARKPANFSDETWKNQRITKVEIIRNSKLEKNFREYKKRIKCEQEDIGFRTVYSREEVEELVENGLGTRSDAFVDIGNRKEGVILYNSPASSYPGRFLYTNVPITVMVFRVAEGKRHSVAIATGKALPSKKHQSHSLMRTENLSTYFKNPFRLERAMAGVFHYEYSEHMGRFQKYPAMILPHALITYNLSATDSFPATGAAEKHCKIFSHKMALTFQAIDDCPHTIVIPGSNKRMNASVCRTMVSKEVQFFSRDVVATPEVVELKYIDSYPELEFLRNGTEYGKLLTKECVYVDQPNLVGGYHHYLLRLCGNQPFMEALQKSNSILVWDFDEEWTIFYLPTGRIASEFGFPHQPNCFHMVIYRTRIASADPIVWEDLKKTDYTQFWNHDEEVFLTEKRMNGKDQHDQFDDETFKEENGQNDVHTLSSGISPASSTPGTPAFPSTPDYYEQSPRPITPTIPSTPTFDFPSSTPSVSPPILEEPTSTPLSPIVADTNFVPKPILRKIGMRPRNVTVQWREDAHLVDIREIPARGVEHDGMTFAQRQKQEHVTEAKRKQQEAERLDAEKKERELSGTDELFKNAMAGNSGNRESTSGSRAHRQESRESPSPVQGTNTPSPALSSPRPPPSPVPTPSTASPVPPFNMSVNFSHPPSTYAYQSSPMPVAAFRSTCPPPPIRPPPIFPRGVPPPTFPANLPPMFRQPPGFPAGPVHSIPIPTNRPPPPVPPYQMMHQPSPRPILPPPTSLAIPPPVLVTQTLSPLKPRPSTIGSSQFPTSLQPQTVGSSQPNPLVATHLMESGEEEMDIDDDDSSQEVVNTDERQDEAVKVVEGQKENDKEVHEATKQESEEPVSEQPKPELNDILLTAFLPGPSTPPVSTRPIIPESVLALLEAKRAPSTSSSRDTDLRNLPRSGHTINPFIINPKTSAAKPIANALLRDGDDDDEEGDVMPKSKQATSSRDSDYRPSSQNSHRVSQENYPQDRDDRRQDRDDRVNLIPMPRLSKEQETARNFDQNCQKKLRTNTERDTEKEAAGLVNGEALPKGSMNLFPNVIRKFLTKPTATTSKPVELAVVNASSVAPSTSSVTAAPDQSHGYTPQTIFNLQAAEQTKLAEAQQNNTFGEYVPNLSDTEGASSSTKNTAKKSPKKPRDHDSVQPSSSDARVQEAWLSKTSGIGQPSQQALKSQQGQQSQQAQQVQQVQQPQQVQQHQQAPQAPQAPQAQQKEIEYITLDSDEEDGELRDDLQVLGPPPGITNRVPRNFQQMNQQVRGQPGGQPRGNPRFSNGNNFGLPKYPHWLADLKQSKDPLADSFVIFVDPLLTDQSLTPAQLDELFQKLLELKQRTMPSPRLHSVIYIHDHVFKLMGTNSANKEMTEWFGPFDRFMKTEPPLVELLPKHISCNNNYIVDMDIEAQCLHHIHKYRKSKEAIYLTERFKEDSADGKRFSGRGIRVLTIKQLADLVGNQIQETINLSN